VILGAEFWMVLAAATGVAWLLPARLRPGLVAAVSFVFLVRLDPSGLAAMLAFALAFRWLAPVTRRPGGALVLPVLIVSILGYLAWFKYFPPILAALRGEGPAASVLVPVGLSYFSFKLIHYALETARGTLPPSRLGDYLAWVFLFPIFTAGPIERFDHFLAERPPRLDARLVAEGLTRIAHGLVKKFVLVGILIESLSPGHGSAGHVGRLLAELSERPVPEVWGFCALSFLIMYLDFSAYSDIAIGASLLLGFRIMENFDWPILASDISAFWSRWHMTLTGWCQSYVFMPVLGLTRRLPLAVFTGFLAIGLWHAGTSCWAAWGLYHATGVITFHAWQSARERRGATGDAGPLRRAAGTILTLAFVTGSFAILAGDEAGGLRDGLRILARLAGVDVPARAEAA
jgi:alginate O-acetyltransferase complex protein AlgI